VLAQTAQLAVVVVTAEVVTEDMVEVIILRIIRIVVDKVILLESLDGLLLAQE